MKTLVGVALAGALVAGSAGLAVAQDGTGTIEFEVIKGGIGVGGQSGEGTLSYQGEEHALTIGGVTVGATLGITKAELEGSVSGLHSVEDIEGIYTQGEAAAAAGGGFSGIVMQNSNGVELELTGREEGILASLDLGGMEISLKE